MKIFIDMGHPAHVHYFKNLIRIMQNKNHEFFLTARRKDCTFELLNFYNFKYFDRGKGSPTLIGKIFYMIKADYLLLKHAKDFNPDLFLSFGSPYAAHVSKLLNKPHIAFSDTGHARFNNIMYVPFTNSICTPVCFKKDFGKKQIRFNGYMELCSLHPNYFKPNPKILNSLGIGKNEKYVILRLVSWKASHDIGQLGLRSEDKQMLIKQISKHAEVFISSEEELPHDLRKYQIKISPEKIHDALAYATLYLGEGATMASECAMLGTPAIYISSLSAGTLEEQEKNGLIFGYRTSQGVIDKALELLETSNIKEIWQVKRQKMLFEKIDVTAFMVWFVENYPESARIMENNPYYQYRFKTFQEKESHLENE